MEKSSFFNSINGDRKYKAEDLASYFGSFISNGIFPNPGNNLQVIANNDMTVTLKPGKGWINGYFYENTEDLILSIDPADGVLDRIDRVVLRLDYVNREIKAAVKKGTFASSPVAPELQRDVEIYELGLADISIVHGAISIVSENITDTRLNLDLCGVTNSLITVDVGIITNQFSEDFDAWFETIKGALDGDVAGNLYNLIEQKVGLDLFNEHLADNAPHNLKVNALAYAYINFKNQLTEQEQTDIESNQELMQIINSNTVVGKIRDSSNLYDIVLADDLIKENEAITSTTFMYNITADEKNVYVANGKYLTKLKSNSLTVEVPTIDTGADCRALIADTDYLYVTGGSLGSYYGVKKFNKLDLTVVATSTLISSENSAIALDDEFVYVGTGSGTVRKYKKTNLTYIATTPAIGGSITSIALDDSFIYAGSRNSAFIKKYRKTDMSLVAEISATNIHGLTVDDKYLYVSDNRDIKKINKTNLSIVKSISMSVFCPSILVNENYLHVGVSDGRLIRIDKDSLSAIDEVQTGSSTVISLAKDKSYVYAGVRSENKVFSYLALRKILGARRMD